MMKKVATIRKSETHNR